MAYARPETPTSSKSSVRAAHTTYYTSQTTRGPKTCGVYTAHQQPSGYSFFGEGNRIQQTSQYHNMRTGASKSPPPPSLPASRNQVKDERERERATQTPSSPASSFDSFAWPNNHCPGHILFYGTVGRHTFHIKHTCTHCSPRIDKETSRTNRKTPFGWLRSCDGFTRVHQTAQQRRLLTSLPTFSPDIKKKTKKTKTRRHD